MATVTIQRHGFNVCLFATSFLETGLTLFPCFNPVTLRTLQSMVLSPEQ